MKLVVLNDTLRDVARSHALAHPEDPLRNRLRGEEVICDVGDLFCLSPFGVIQGM
ncbi:MAG: hypothetical protein ACYC28_11505 [Longimicrobiales bacterium]